MSGPDPGPGRRLLGLVAGVVAAGAHGVVGFVMLISGLVAPLWAVAAFGVVWVVLAVLGVRWWWRHPLAALAAPAIGAVVWVVTLVVGDTLLGWTA